MKIIELDNRRFTTLIVDPTVSLAEDAKVHCIYCGHWLMSMNKKFAVIAHGATAVGGGGLTAEVPLTVFRVTKMCGQCRHYYLIYFEP